MKSRENLEFITLSQIVGCCLVVLGHSFPFVTKYPEWGGEFREFLYAFHMPLFVWCSGYLFAFTCQSDRRSMVEYVRQRTIKLMIPYFVFSLIGIVPKIMASSFLNDTVSISWEWIVRAFMVPRDGVWGHFWFIPMIYLCGVIGFLLDKISKDKNWWAGFVVVALAASFFKAEILEWFALNDVIKLFVFYSLGVLTYRIKCKVDVGWKWLSIGATCLVVSLVAFSFAREPFMLGHIRNMVIAVCMIAFIVIGCRFTQIFLTVDRKSSIAQTYQIFILSWPCQLVVGIFLERIFHVSWDVFFAVVFIVGMIVPMFLIKAVDKLESKTGIRILSIILGR